MRVAVIGAGAAGMSVLRLIPKNSLPKESQIVCFESSTYFGGQWRQYKPKTQNDYHKDPSSSMYKNLVTNLPTIVMQYPDCKWIHDESFVHHSEVARYLDDYYRQHDLEKYITFNRKVTNLNRCLNSVNLQWSVTSEDQKSCQKYYDIFDYVFLCNGHFSIPKLLDIPGIERFPGNVFHARWFDDPSLYKDQNVLIIGKGPSGVDICCELLPYCKKVIVASTSAKSCFANYVDKVDEVGFISKYDPGSGFFVFDDGKFLDTDIDTVILCTGYLYDIPFLDKESCEIEIDDGFISPLYKYTLHPKFPSLFFIGLNQRICPFTVFYYQSMFCWSVVTGAITLPSNLVEEALSAIHERLQTVKKRVYFCLSSKEEEEFVLYLADCAKVDPPPPSFFQIKKLVSEARSVDPVLYKKHRIFISAEDSTVVHLDENGQLIQNY